MSRNDESLASLIESTNINQHNGYCGRWKRHSPSRVAECTDVCHMLTAKNGRKLNASECEQESSLKLIRRIKKALTCLATNYGTLTSVSYQTWVKQERKGWACVICTCNEDIFLCAHAGLLQTTSMESQCLRKSSADSSQTLATKNVLSWEKGAPSVTASALL